MGEKNYKFPKTPGACADRLQKLKDSKEPFTKKIKEIEDEEKALRAHIINILPASNLEGARGKLGNVVIQKKSKPQVKDWSKFYTFMSRNKRFDLMQRRLSDSVVVDLIEEKKGKVPGVEMYEYKTVKLTKVVN